MHHFHGESGRFQVFHLHWIIRQQLKRRDAKIRADSRNKFIMTRVRLDSELLIGSKSINCSLARLDNHPVASFTEQACPSSLLQKIKGNAALPVCDRLQTHVELFDAVAVERP